MKIAYVHGASIPSRAASTVQVMKMCEALSELGNDVLLIVPRKKDIENNIDDAHEYYGVSNTFRIEHVPWARSIGREYLAAIRMVIKIRQFGADIVYSRFAPAGFFAASFGWQVIHELHRPPSQSSGRERWIIEKLLNHPKMVKAVSISAALKRQCITELPKLAAKTIVAHDAADVDMDLMSKRYDLTEFCVGYVGSLYPGRGIDLIIELARECPFAQMHIIGGTPEEISRYKADGWQLSNVHFHGFQRNPIAKNLIHNFDVVLAPYGSRVGIYGAPEADTSAFMSPLKLFEYMAAGKAIICSDHEVLQEVITHEDTALICERGNIAAWAAALRRLWKEPMLRESLGARARDLCVRKYSWRARAEHILNFNT